jgi:hypothetical protein
MNKWIRPPADRFWEKVSTSDGCWEWLGATGDRGYGVFRYKGKNVRAHKFAYELRHGVVPAGLFVCHRCDNPKCVRVDHLFLGTPAENVKDMMEKGRAKFPGAINPKKHEAHHFTKLSELQVQRIRIVGDALTQKRLAELTHMSPQAISSVLRGECWASLGERQALC